MYKFITDRIFPKRVDSHSCAVQVDIVEDEKTNSTSTIIKGSIFEQIHTMVSKNHIQYMDSIYQLVCNHPNEILVDFLIKEKQGDKPLERSLLHLFAIYPNRDYGMLFKGDKEPMVDVLDSEGNTPLCCACLKRNEKAIALLLDRGANPNFIDRHGMCPLSIMLEHITLPSLEMLNLLVDKGANVNQVFYYEGTERRPLFFLLERHIYWSRRLMEHDQLYEKTCKFALKLLEAGADPNFVGEMEDENALHLLTIHNQARLVEILLRGGCDYTRKNKHGFTPLDIATDDDTKAKFVQFIKSINS